MDTYTFGYFIGRYSTRVALYACEATLALNGYRRLSNVARLHKIDTNDPQAVTENVFSCLEYIDW